MKTFKIYALLLVLNLGLFNTNANAQKNKSKLSFYEEKIENKTLMKSNEVSNKSDEIYILTTVVEEVSCYGKNDAEISIEIKGGQAPYKYSLNGAKLVSENNFKRLAAGDHFLIVSDKNGLTKIKKFTIDQPEKISFRDVMIIESSSYFGQYSISVCAQGGHGAISYSINESSPQISGLFTDISPSINSISAIDYEGCSENLLINLIDANSQNETFGFNDKNKNIQFTDLSTHSTINKFSEQ